VLFFFFVIDVRSDMDLKVHSRRKVPMVDTVLQSINQNFCSLKYLVTPNFSGFIKMMW
jgi:hypothetical protein